MADKSASPVPEVSSPQTEVLKKVPSSKMAKVAPAKAVPKALKSPKEKPAHPSTADMVNAAVKSLAERNGSSLQAIKKYLAATYKVDTDKIAPFVKKYLKSAVTTGVLIQTKGKGASGSFKLAVVKKAEAAKPKSKVAAKKPASPKKTAVKKPAAKKTETTKAAAKKPASTKKVAAKKAPVAEKKPAAAKIAKPKSPKAKKVTKAPTAKPKAPKPKKATAAPKTVKAAPKKAAATKK